MTLKNIKIKTIGLHTSIWIGYSLLIFYGPFTFLPLKSALLFALRALTINAIIFYSNTFWLLPKYLFGGRPARFFLIAAMIIATTASISYVTEPYIISDFNDKMHQRDELRRRPIEERPETAPQPGQAMDSNKKFPPPSLFFIPARIHPMIINGIFSSLGMLFLSTFFFLIMRDRELQQKKVNLINQNLEFEMKFLKSQINPHFLFNALNNIYALSIIKAPNAPEMILKLSDMLRFTLYDSDNQKVKIGKELAYISNFIDFQRLKMDTEPNLIIDMNNCDKDLIIEPMLLIPFIENSFKHSHIENTQRGWIKMKIETVDAMLSFSISNSAILTNNSRDLPGGIGLENVRKRLELLYHGRFTLKIETKNDVHSVEMTIDTSKNN